MSKKLDRQFFTTDTDFFSSWFPIDHFFYAPYRYDKENQKIVQKGKIVHLEAHANLNYQNGFSVSIIHGVGKNLKQEEFASYPEALRRMADIIELMRINR